MKLYTRHREAGNDMERTKYSIGSIDVYTHVDNSFYLEYGSNGIPLSGDKAKDLAELITTGKITPKWTDAKVIRTINTDPPRYFLHRFGDKWLGADGWTHNTEELIHHYGADGLVGVDS